jgi:hypothetical protein
MSAGSVLHVMAAETGNELRSLSRNGEMGLPDDRKRKNDDVSD